MAGEIPPTFKAATRVSSQVRMELYDAQTRFPPFASAHEGLAVIEEEFLELREQVFWGAKGATEADYKARMREEAVQLAAMSLRFLIDVCGAS